MLAPKQKQGKLANAADDQLQNWFLQMPHIDRFKVFVTQHVFSLDYMFCLIPKLCA